MLGISYDEQSKLQEAKTAKTTCQGPWEHWKVSRNSTERQGFWIEKCCIYIINLKEKA